MIFNIHREFETFSVNPDVHFFTGPGLAVSANSHMFLYVMNEAAWRIFIVDKVKADRLMHHFFSPYK